MDRHRLMLGLSVCVMLYTTVQLYAQTYTVTDLGALQPTAVIDGPIIFGNLNGEPVRWQNGQIHVLQHYGFGGQPLGANNRGDSVGFVFVPGSDGQLRRAAAFWSPDGQLVLLPGAGETEAHGLNMNRTIAGANLTTRQAMRWNAEAPEEYLTDPAPLLRAAVGIGVDQHSRVWGTIGIRGSHDIRVHVWDVDGQIYELPGVGPSAEHVMRAVNEDGVAAGWLHSFPSTGQPGGASRITLDGGHAILPSLGGNIPHCEGTAINARGDIGGFCAGDWYGLQRSRAVLWPASGRVVDLNTRANLPEWRLARVLGMNGRGHLAVAAIAATASESALPYTHRFLLTPAAQPPAVALHMNRGDFRPGESWQVMIAREGGPADLHVAIILPDGTTTLFLTNVETLSYIVSTIARGPYPVTAGASLAYQWHGLEPVGTYHIVAALARPGSLADGRIDEGDIVALDWKAFSFAPGELIAGR